jgi:AAA15 family ATPase/GTPase
MVALFSKILSPLLATYNIYFREFYNVKIEPFAFSENKRNEPSEFELFFRTTLAEYRYNLHIKQDTVIYESLERVKMATGRQSALFTRNEKGVELKGDFKKFVISEDISASLPLLSYLGITYRKNEIVNDILEWIEQSILFLNYGNPYLEIGVLHGISEDIKKLVLEMMMEMDLDIDEFRYEDKGENEYEVFTTHKVGDDIVELKLSNESSGTKKLFVLLPFIAKGLSTGMTLVIDELDAKIHPVLLRHIIMMFNDMSINRYGAQLIFTSHDLTTMNSEVFRRDEIWFAAKGNQQNTKLYSLVEFKNDNHSSVRKDAKFDKQYLEGKYGADPYLRKIIDWSEENA